MSDRYQRLYTINNNIYADGAPIIISAGALLKDTRTGVIIVQLKLRNFSHKTIKAVNAEIIPYDISGKLLGNPIEHQYLDFSAKHNDEFGSKIAINLPNNSTRGFDVRILRAVFQDNTEWVADESHVWTPITYQNTTLAEYFGNNDLADEYRLTYGQACKFIPKKLRDLWICSCGQINSQSKDRCDKCGGLLSAFLSLDAAKLRNSCQERLIRKRQAAEIAALKAAKERRKKIIISAITIPLVVALIILIWWFATETDRVLSNANDLYQDEKLVEAMDLLNEYNKPDATDSFAQTIERAMEDNIVKSINTRKYSQAMEYIRAYRGYIDNSSSLLLQLQNVCNHNYKVTESIDETCTTDGYTLYVCTVCEYSERVVQNALGHISTSSITKQSTCAEEGIQTTTCSRCEESTTESIAKLPHEFDISITLNPSCILVGEQTLTCRGCGTTEKETIPMIDHSYNYVVTKSATCTEYGVQTQVCSVCGENGDTRSVDPHGHNYTKTNVSAPDCTNHGTDKLVCVTCNYTYTQSVNALGHTWKNATCTAAKTCARCGMTSGSPLGHYWKNVAASAPANVEAVCSRCNIKYADTITVTSNAPITIGVSYDDSVVINITGISYQVYKSLWDGKVELVIILHGTVTAPSYVLSTTISLTLYDENGKEIDKPYGYLHFDKTSGTINQSSNFTIRVSQDVKSIHIDIKPL